MPPPVRQPQPPSEQAVRAMRRDAVAASRRARAKRLLSSGVPDVPALAVLTVLADGSLDLQLAEGLPTAAVQDLLQGIREKLGQRLTEIHQEGG